MDDHDARALFDANRPKCPTQDETRLMSEAASAEATGLRLHQPHGAWDVEANAWQRLADAAYACNCILVRRHLSFCMGEPESKPPKEMPDA